MKARTRRALLVALPIVVGGIQVRASAEDFGLGDSFALDSMGRNLDPRREFSCPSIELVTYRGTEFRYEPLARVHPAFRERLMMFEKTVIEVATQFYGRGPERILQLGSYNCRPIRLYPNLLSEHALGNAVDVAGFVFGPIRSRDNPLRLPQRLRRGFAVTVLDHWNATHGVGEIHSKFLRALARRFIERTHIFRVLLGPAYPGHRNHFHFDCAPYGLVSIFEGDGHP